MRLTLVFDADDSLSADQRLALLLRLARTHLGCRCTRYYRIPPTGPTSRCEDDDNDE